MIKKLENVIILFPFEFTRIVVGEREVAVDGRNGVIGLDQVETADSISQLSQIVATGRRCCGNGSFFCSFK